MEYGKAIVVGGFKMGNIDVPLENLLVDGLVVRLREKMQRLAIAISPRQEKKYSRSY